MGCSSCNRSGDARVTCCLCGEETGHDQALPIPSRVTPHGHPHLDYICLKCLGPWAAVEGRLVQSQVDMRSGLMMTVMYLLGRADAGHPAEDTETSG